MNLPKLTLVLGGARSGKSAFAEQLALNSGRRPVYLATCDARDPETAARIAAHRRRRDGRWRELEVPLDLGTAISWVAADEVMLIDCMTLWLSNIMMAERDLDDALGDILGRIKAFSAPIIMVSNELGLGLVPETRLGRDFRDNQGLLNQRIAATAERVVFVAAGLPLVLKGAK